MLYIMQNTTFCIFVICSGYIHVINFFYKFYNHEQYNFYVILEVEDTEVTCYA